MANKDLNEQLELSETIGLIYDAASQPELWPELLAKLERLAVVEEAQSTHALRTHGNEPKLYNNLLRQHFKRALSINRKLYSLQLERDAASAILDRLPIGVILVDVDYTPVALNQHARDYIESKQLLLVQHGKLVTSSRASTDDLHRLVNQAIIGAVAEPQEQGGETLILDRSGTSPCSLHITPASHASLCEEKGLAAVFIASSDIRQPVSPDSLVVMYGLTKAEARLLQSLLLGSHTLAEAAEELGLSIHTVRTQIKTIYEKTGTHSQSELIKKVMCSPSGLIGKKQSALPVADLKALESTVTVEQVSESPFHMLSLFDGRKLEYREFGDPEGRPLIYLHGILHSREIFHPDSTYADDHGIRIIAPERPGFGRSSLQKNASLRSYCSDIEQLANHLELESFHIYGDGDAGPAVLACANLLSERVRRAAVSGCMPDPQFEDVEGMLPFDKKLHNMARVTPKSVLYPFCKIILKAVKKNNNYFELMASDFCATDKAIVFSDQHQCLFRQSMENLEISPDNHEGFIRDYFARLIPWDFDITSTVTEIDLWHGVNDCYSMIGSARSIAKAIPNCRARFLDPDGHYLFISHIDQILDALFSGA